MQEEVCPDASVTQLTPKIRVEKHFYHNEQHQSLNASKWPCSLLPQRHYFCAKLDIC